MQTYLFWRRAWLSGLFLSCVMLVGCQRASRYPAAASVKPLPESARPEVKALWSWYLPEGWQEPADMPIRFVVHGQQEWDSLREFLSVFPPPSAGSRTIHLNQTPFGILGAMALTDNAEVVKIKVPLGLPDPKPHIPSANPATFAKWKLGRQIFFARKLMSGNDTFACATCHNPALGFAEDRSITSAGLRNAHSLINCVFNRHQFWDGRATALEEVIVRTLSDELQPDAKNPKRGPQETHRWGGLVRNLGEDADYRLRFKLAFGIDRPTQDAIAKALATYLRTILAGNSLVDRAEQERRRKNAPQLLAEHFLPLLDAPALRALETHQETKENVAKKLEHGHRLFQSKGCSGCHPAPLYTDHDFHNVGIGESETFRQPGAETGRFAHVPIGLKESRLIGAFKTPTLRALPRTAPYFHDGSYPDLRSVVKYFNHSINGNRYLAPSLRLDAAGNPKALDMNEDDQAALVLFLRALDGDAVDDVIRNEGAASAKR
jgi:cytochrome c peroxidase